MDKRSLKSHRPLPKLKLSGYTLRRPRRLNRPWKECCLIGSAWIFLAHSFRYARSSLLGPAWFPRERPLVSAGNAQWTGQAHHGWVEGSDKATLVSCFTIPHNNFLCVFRFIGILYLGNGCVPNQEIFGHVLWGQDCLTSNPGFTSFWLCILGRLIRYA